jgi:hypothetical protein
VQSITTRRMETHEVSIARRDQIEKAVSKLMSGAIDAEERTESPETEADGYTGRIRRVFL